MKSFKILARLALLNTFISKPVTITDNYAKTQNFEDIANQTITDLYILRHNIRQVKEKPHKITEIIENLHTCLTVLNNASVIINEDQETAVMRIGLLSNSINTSLSRLVELLEEFNKNKIEWKKESTTSTLVECKKTRIVLNQKFDTMKSNDAVSKNVEEKLEDLNNTLTTLQKLL